MQQHMPSVGGKPAARSVADETATETMLRPWVTTSTKAFPKNYLVQCEFAQHLPERLPVAVYAADESGEPRQPLLRG